MKHRFAIVLFAAACGGTPAVVPTQIPGPVAAPAAPPSASAPSAPMPVENADADAPISQAAIVQAENALAQTYPAAKDEIHVRVKAAGLLWRASDGDFTAFCLENFVADGAAREALFKRLEAIDEQIAGHDLEIARAARWNTEVDTGPILPIDSLLAAYDPAAHVQEDLFASKVGFAVLLNFPLTTLAERIKDGGQYTREMWAQVRLASQFEARVPGKLELAASSAGAAAEQYIASYNIWMHHVLAEDNARLFPSGKRLISHWNLRDELKANYAEKDGIGKQRTIAKVMDRIVTQTIPKAVIDNPNLDWNPFTNKVTVAAAGTIEADAPKNRATVPSEEPEPAVREQLVLAHFHAARAIDPFAPTAPTYIDRRFEAAEIPEQRVRQMLTEILESPLKDEVARQIHAKLNRDLEPQDLWFPLASPGTAETELDAVTRKKYPTANAFAADVPRILRDLGFSAARSKYLSEHIAVDPSRGAGHAMEAERRGDKAHLRTRVEKNGMDYKGYNIAVHELGHNIEQTFSLYDIDHTLLRGVPNIAFTEALAFLFQARDRELLGRPRVHGEADRLRVLDTFWASREIAGSALVELDVWHWLYAHPNATAPELRDATVQIARATWDRYYAPLLGGKGTALLGIYSHTIADPLYLFNYVLGHLIAFQVEQALDGKDKATFGKEFERDARQGRILPDLWMTAASGKPVGTESLLAATQKALAK